MSEHERKIDVLVGNIARGNLTRDQLKRAVKIGRADAARLGKRIESTSLDAIAAGEETLQRLDREESKLRQFAG